ncbi:CoA transferase [Verticiella sediminum]|uniref:CoA transferase n=1 Tax=Verticiella sediminum TaxID=1247510 RepID=A0A556AYU5_9BURK|nr:CoA transferase [Verticiella sediminum]TSH98109.1 CoA transferase [Verticiella sediminum]
MQPRPAAQGGTGPLAGYRVLELCSTIAGPACTRLLADFGAEVIKIEPPEGDPVRNMGSHDGDVSLYGLTILRNKRLVSIDLRTDEGRALVRELAAGCDVVVENFRPGTLERMGLDYGQLAARNPGLVMVRISGYGQTGPYATRPGYGVTCEAVGGVRHMTGDPDRPPARVALAVTDEHTAVYAAFGAMMALLHRERTGQGQVVDAALYEAAFSMMEPHVPAFARLGKVPGRVGPNLPSTAPNSLYPTSDGEYVLIAANNDAIFQRLAAAMGDAGLAQDPRYATQRARAARVAELNARVGDWTRTRTAAEIETQLLDAGVPVARIYTIADIFADPHYRARDMLLSLPHETLGDVTVAGVVPKLSATPGGVRHLGGAVGADTRAVLREMLRLTEDELDRLQDQGVIVGLR